MKPIFHHIIFLSTCYFYRCLFCNLYFPICTIKIPKIFMLLSLLDLTFISDREGIDNPFIMLVARFLFVCAGTRDLLVTSYWIDTLVLKNWGRYLRYFAASPFPLQGKTNASSRGSNLYFDWSTKSLSIFLAFLYIAIKHTGLAIHREHSKHRWLCISMIHKSEPIFTWQLKNKEKIDRRCWQQRASHSKNIKSMSC